MRVPKKKIHKFQNFQPDLILRQVKVGQKYKQKITKISSFWPILRLVRVDEKMPKITKISNFISGLILRLVKVGQKIPKIMKRGYPYQKHNLRMTLVIRFKSKLIFLFYKSLF